MPEFVGRVARNIIGRQIDHHRKAGPSSMRRQCEPGRVAGLMMALAVAWGALAETARAEPRLGAPVRQESMAELVAANHVLAKLKVVDAFGHITMRDPADPQRYLMARAIAPLLVTEQDI